MSTILISIQIWKYSNYQNIFVVKMYSIFDMKKTCLKVIAKYVYTQSVLSGPKITRFITPIPLDFGKQNDVQNGYRIIHNDISIKKFDL